jgi:hypothetical protein
MSKCDFCVDELDAGRPPACVAACPVRALETVRIDAEDPPSPPVIPPLPRPELTKPVLQLKPHGDAAKAHGRQFDLEPRPPHGLREWSLVCFTLLIQIAAGLAIWLGTAGWWLFRPEEAEALEKLHRVGLPLVPAMTLAAIGVSLLHLGKPGRMFRAMSNLRSSPLSLEILLVCLFFVVGLAAPRSWLLPAAGLLLIGGMARVYMLRTVPAWNRPQTFLIFLVTGLLLGGMLTLALLATLSRHDYTGIAWAVFAIVLVLEIFGRGRFYASYRREGV